MKLEQMYDVLVNATELKYSRQANLATSWEEEEKKQSTNFQSSRHLSSWKPRWLAIIPLPQISITLLPFSWSRYEPNFRDLIHMIQSSWGINWIQLLTIFYHQTKKLDILLFVVKLGFCSVECCNLYRPDLVAYIVLLKSFRSATLFQHAFL